jgi:20S proteasome alpha/beta subunit
MTVCIGVICENGKAIIAIADKMITASHLDIEFEHPSMKLTRLGDSCMIMTGGTVPHQTDILRRLKKKINSHVKMPIPEIVQAAIDEFQQERLNRIENAILRPRGYTLEWYNANQAILDETLVLKIDGMMEDFELELVMLIAGIDEDGGHLYVIYNPGEAAPLTDIGYAVIGVGEKHAESTLIMHNYSISTPLNKATYIAYEAKKIAEKAPGVGEETDILIIDQYGIHQMNKDTLEQLSQLYSEKMQNQTKFNKKFATALDSLTLVQE